MSELLLYSTSACHLCELAEDLLDDARRQGVRFRYRVLDIAEDEGLLERYGVRIPVLLREDGEELGWPFDTPALVAFIGG
jgi:hypothetical protein